VGHLRGHGFPVTTDDRDDLRSIKTRLGVPTPLQSCHTAEVAGYVIEGHVPADVLDRLLRERPKVAGLAVPGMPIGSPGMESPGAAAEPYRILAIDRAGQVTVYARR
jgi:hypothetical protein